MFVNKLFTYLTGAISKNKRRSNVKSSTFHFHIKTKILTDFQICISVPLSLDTRYGVYAVTTATHIILIFIVKSPKDLEMSTVGSCFENGKYSEGHE